MRRLWQKAGTRACADMMQMRGVTAEGKQAMREFLARPAARKVRRP